MNLRSTRNEMHPKCEILLENFKNTESKQRKQRVRNVESPKSGSLFLIGVIFIKYRQKKK